MGQLEDMDDIDTGEEAKSLVYTTIGHVLQTLLFGEYQFRYECVLYGLTPHARCLLDADAHCCTQHVVRCL